MLFSPVGVSFLNANVHHKFNCNVCLCLFMYVCQVLAEKVHIRALSIAQRVSLLHEGLSDSAGKEVQCLLIKL